MMQSVRTSAAGNLESALLCAKTHVDADTSNEILTLVGSEPDWDAILKTASEHSLTPIFCRNIEEYGGEALPSSWRRRLSEENLLGSCRNLAMTAELFRVLEALESRGVCATPYKGPVLAAQAYGDVAMPQLSDLDIIVPQRQIVAAHDALLARGFRPVISGVEPQAGGRQVPGQYAYRSDAETLVELHTELTLRYFPRGLDLTKLVERRERVQIAGRRVLTFSPEDTLLLLCVHGSKPFWERLGWIADIAALSRALGPLDWGVRREGAR